MIFLAQLFSQIHFFFRMMQRMSIRFQFCVQISEYGLISDISLLFSDQIMDLISATNSGTFFLYTAQNFLQETNRQELLREAAGSYVPVCLVLSICHLHVFILDWTFASKKSDRS